MAYPCGTNGGQFIGAASVSQAPSKNPEIGKIKIKINFDFKFGFKSIILVQMQINFLSTSTKFGAVFYLLGPPRNTRCPDLL
jgi:hypothetical protein